MIIRPTWPLGLRFIDSKSREFEVTKVVMGKPENCISYEVEVMNGWIIQAQNGEHPQTKVGFVDVKNREKLIEESVDKMNEFVKNGHIIWK